MGTRSEKHLPAALSTLPRNFPLGSDRTLSLTGNLSSTWGTQPVNARYGRPNGNAPSPYIREINNTLARKNDRTMKNRRQPLPAVSSRSYVPTRPIPGTRRTGSLRSGFDSASLAGSSISALSVYDDGYHGNIAPSERSFGEEETVVVYDVEIQEYRNFFLFAVPTKNERFSCSKTPLQFLVDGVNADEKGTRQRPKLDPSGTSWTKFLPSSALCSLVLNSSLRPRVSDKAAQTDGEDAAAASATAKELDAMLDDNYKLRKLVEDLRFRLSELTHEKEVLEEENSFLRQHHQDRPATAKPSMSFQDDEIQTEPQIPALAMPCRRASDDSSMTSRLDDEHEPTDELFNYLDSVLETGSGVSTPRNAINSQIDDPERAEAIGQLRQVLAGHFSRVGLLRRVDDRKRDEALQKLQGCLRAHLQRQRFLALREDVS